jgi:tRNA pseudouridine32 synthase/23S rRNA pseudouridine746 synthase
MQILFADAHLIAVDKPAGLLSVPGRGEALRDCVSARVQALYPDALIVHRLDMATSGLLLLARDAAMQRSLGLSFADRSVRKDYVAIVEGWVDADDGSIELPIGADWPNRPRQQVDRLHGKPSVTKWRVLSRDPVANTTRLALQPLTGRTHQLRVHLQAIGHTIVGDALYGTLSHRLMLHAHRLELTHPATSQPLVLTAPLPF